MSSLAGGAVTAPRIALGLACLGLLSSGPAPDVMARRATRYPVAPLVVPVTTLPEPPYPTQVIWTAFTVGSDAPGAFHGRELHECEQTWYFLRREIPDWRGCHALELVPWLRLPGPLSDTALARRAVAYADSATTLDFVADSFGLVHALVVAVVGRAAPPTPIRVTYRARRLWRDVTVDTVVLIGLPRDSAQVMERQLIPALPYVHGLSPMALVQDSAGDFHLHPAARRHFLPDSIAPLAPPTTLQLDVAVHSCGSLACVTYYPTYAITVPHTSPVQRVYVETRTDEGVLLQEVADLDTVAAHSSRPYGRVRRLWATFADDVARFPITGRWPTDRAPVITIAWQDRVATLRVPGLWPGPPAPWHPFSRGPTTRVPGGR